MRALLRSAVEFAVRPSVRWLCNLNRTTFHTIMSTRLTYSTRYNACDGEQPEVMFVSHRIAFIGFRSQSVAGGRYVFRRVLIGSLRASAVAMLSSCGKERHPGSIGSLVPNPGANYPNWIMGSFDVGNGLFL